MLQNMLEFFEARIEEAFFLTVGEIDNL